ncbi:MAG TPA: TrkA C-terminal domain-containing protein [Thermoleophilia bacterium]|nr:TrkA C-terminal domain-containing protein [Thermoleophilia bacterium]
MPDTLSERRLSDLAVRRRTGATVVAVQVDERELVSPTPDTLLMPGMRLVMVGSPESEGRFIALVEQR